jgi:predicted enzyme related to lactoylglutathione lyase
MSDQAHNVAVWFEIPVTDIDAAKTFYEEVLSVALNKDDTGPNPMVMFNSADNTGVSGHLYPGKPATAGTGNTIHLHCADPLEDAMKRVSAAGGEVVSPIIPIPSGRFVYIHDPDGNSVGLFNFAA